MARVTATLVLLGVGCSFDPMPDPTPEPGPQSYTARDNRDRDLLSTALDVRLATLEATASIRIAAGAADGVSFEAQGLQVSEVRDDRGPIDWRHEGGRLLVGAPPTESTVHVDYAFAVHDAFDGLLAGGSTLVWPYFCGNLFPCKSTPADGLTFTLAVHDPPPGQIVVHPAAIAEAPSYVLAWATGPYSVLELGTTAAGTSIAAWYKPGGEDDAHDGTVHLRAAFEWYEEVLGPYPFGSRAGSVAVAWGPGAIGGMEHHPYWHVAESTMSDPLVQVHEAAHGWYGNGVRMACWEDFVLSEGTVTYLAARALGAVVSQTIADQAWATYETHLATAMQTPALKIAWPDSCGEIDIIQDRLFSNIPYMKGALFYRALEQRVGAEPLLAVLRSFFQARVGTAARMQELLDAVRDQTGYDPTACAQAWLRSEEIPNPPDCR
jgi:aminopeptidase N